MNKVWIRGGFHKSWVHRVKHEVHSNLGEKQLVRRKAQIHDAKLQIREKDGPRAQITSVERKLLYEIHPRIPNI
jgi:hypothetical protein